MAILMVEISWHPVNPESVHWREKLELQEGNWHNVIFL